jgi:vacuolar-type H+-ATPase subunit H
MKTTSLTKKQQLIKEYIELSTKKQLKESADLLNKANEMDFDTVDQYFAYFIDSVTNGQRQQAKGLYNNLSDVEKEEFEDWFEDNLNLWDHETIDKSHRVFFPDLYPNGETRIHENEQVDTDELLTAGQVIDYANEIGGYNGEDNDNEIFSLKNAIKVITKGGEIKIEKVGDKYKLIGELDEISLAGLGNIGKKIWDKASDKADNFVDNTRAKADKFVGKVVDKAKEVGAGISKEYNKGVASDTEKKLVAQMQKVKDIIIKYNETAKKAGIPPINPRKMMGILNTIPKS